MTSRIVVARERVQTLNYPYIKTQAVADLVVARKLKPLASPAVACTVTGTREFLKYSPGDLIILDSDHLGVSGIKMRILAVQLGALDSGTITLRMIEDRYSVSSPDIQSSNPVLESLQDDPVPVPIISWEVPRFLMKQLVLNGEATDINQPYLNHFCKKQTPNTSFTSAVSTDNVTFVDDGFQGEFTQQWTLVNNYPKNTPLIDPVGITVIGDVPPIVSTLAQIEGGQSLLLIGNELLSYSGFVPIGTNQWRLTGVRRGQLDTVPQDHNAFDIVWLVDIDTVGAARYIPGATVYSKANVLTNRFGVDLTTAPTTVTTIVERTKLPPIADNITLNSANYPGAVLAAAPVTFVWARRPLDSDVVIEPTSPDIPTAFSYGFDWSLNGTPQTQVSFGAVNTGAHTFPSGLIVLDFWSFDGINYSYQKENRRFYASTPPTVLQLFSLPLPVPSQRTVYFAGDSAAELKIDTVLSGRFNPPSCFGTHTGVGSGTVLGIDTANTLTVTLNPACSVIPASTSASNQLNGANRIAIQTAGGALEVLSFQTATLVSGTTYQLSNLIRGLRGTESTPTTQAAMASGTFVLINSGTGDQTFLDAIESAPIPDNLLHNYELVLSGAGPTATHTHNGIDLRPFAPMGVTKTPTGSGDLTITWVRRDRFGASGLMNPPMSETTESYNIQIRNAADTATIRTLTSTTPSVVYTAAMQATDGYAGTLRVRVAQVSAAYGTGKSHLAVV